MTKKQKLEVKRKLLEGILHEANECFNSNVHMVGMKDDFIAELVRVKVKRIREELRGLK